MLHVVALLLPLCTSTHNSCSKTVLGGRSGVERDGQSSPLEVHYPPPPRVRTGLQLVVGACSVETGVCLSGGKNISSVHRVSVFLILPLS